MAVKFCLRLPKVSRPTNLGDGFEFHANPSKGTVILIHGLTGTPNEMKFIATYLNRQGYSVICPRLAYHGEPIHILKNGKWREFYQSVVDTLIKTHSWQKPVFVAGLSMGALLALLLAEQFPKQVAGVVCISPTLFFDGWNVPWSHCLLPLAYYTPLRYFAYHKEEPPYGLKNERVRQLVHKYYEHASLSDSAEASKYGYPYFPVTLLCELKQVITRVKKKLSKIQAPVQLIQAYEDDMTSVKNSNYIYDHVGSSKKEIVLLYNSYHVITADQERETAAQKMAEFFTSIQGQSEQETLNQNKANAEVSV